MGATTLGDDRPGVVVGHDVLGAYHDIVARLDDFAVRKADSVFLDNLFHDGLGHARAVCCNGCKEP